MEHTEDNRYCLCGGVIRPDGFCNLCGIKVTWFDNYNGSVDRAFAKTNYKPEPRLANSLDAYCAECNRPLVDYICYTCDTDLVRDMTTEYHPYLWEMSDTDRLFAHAMGVAM